MFHLGEILPVLHREFLLLTCSFSIYKAAGGKLTLGDRSSCTEVAPIVSVVGAGEGPLDFRKHREVTGLQHVESPHAEINPDIISPNTAKETITVSYRNNPH